MQGVGLGLTQASQFLGTAALQAMKDQADVDKLKLANQLAQDNMQVQADIDVGKQGQINQQALQQNSDFKQAQASKITDIQKGILQGIIAKNAQNPNGEDDAQGSGYSDYTTDTDKTMANYNQMDVTDQNNPSYQPTESQKADAYLQAASQVGAISPDTTATLGQKNEGLMYKSLWEQSKEQGRDDREASREKSRMDIMLAGLKSISNGNDNKTPSVILAAELIQKDEASRGNKITLSQANDLLHKSADEGNNYAMAYTKAQQESNNVGPNGEYKSVDDALAAGRASYVNSRMPVRSSTTPPPSKTPAPSKLHTLFPVIK